MGALGKRELELQQMRIDGRKAKKRRLVPLAELRESISEVKPRKGKRRGKKRKSVHSARDAEKS